MHRRKGLGVQQVWGAFLGMEAFFSHQIAQAEKVQGGHFYLQQVVPSRRTLQDIKKNRNGAGQRAQR